MKKKTLCQPIWISWKSIVSFHLSQYANLFRLCQLAIIFFFFWVVEISLNCKKSADLAGFKWSMLNMWFHQTYVWLHNRKALYLIPENSKCTKQKQSSALCMFYEIQLVDQYTHLIWFIWLEHTLYDLIKFNWSKIGWNKAKRKSYTPKIAFTLREQFCGSHMCIIRWHTIASCMCVFSNTFSNAMCSSIF